MTELDLKQIREEIIAVMNSEILYMTWREKNFPYNILALLDRLEKAELERDEREAKIMGMLEANMRLVKKIEERDAQLKVCVEALKKAIDWSEGVESDTISMSEYSSWNDWMKEATEALEKVGLLS